MEVLREMYTRMTHTVMKKITDLPLKNNCSQTEEGESETGRRPPISRVIFVHRSGVVSSDACVDRLELLEKTVDRSGAEPPIRGDINNLLAEKQSRPQIVDTARRENSNLHSHSPRFYTHRMRFRLHTHTPPL